MPKGPNGQKRPADAIGCAVNVARIATREVEDTKYVSQNRHKSGVAGAKARMKNVSGVRRSHIATQAAQARWKEDKMENVQTPCSELDVIYAAKRKAGLVDVKFLHKNLDEASPELIEAELVEIQNLIKCGNKAKPLDFGDLRLKKS